MKFFHPIRLFVFVVAVIALANFFEAGRLIADEQTFSNIFMSVSSLFILFSSLLVIGYWIYEEEKDRNNIKIKFGFYEWLYKRKAGK